MRDQIDRHDGCCPNIRHGAGSRLELLEPRQMLAVTGPYATTLGYIATMTSGSAGDNLQYTVNGAQNDSNADRMNVNATFTAAIPFVSIALDRNIPSPLPGQFGLRFNLNGTFTNNTGARVTGFTFSINDVELGRIEADDGFHPGEAHFHPKGSDNGPVPVTFDTSPSFTYQDIAVSSGPNQDPFLNPSQDFQLLGGTLLNGQQFLLGDAVPGSTANDGVWYHAAEGGSAAGGNVTGRNEQTISEGVRHHTLTITAILDQPPTAGNGSASTQELEPVEIDLRPLVSDDTTADGDLVYNIVSGPGSGTLVPTGTPGVFTYTPGAELLGQTSFTYNVTDSAGQTSNTATFTIDVNQSVGNGQVLFDSGTGVVRIGGTGGDDRIYTSRSGNRLIVTRNERVIASDILIDQVSEIRIFGRGGDDTLYDAGTNKHMVLSGGGGADQLSGGNNWDLILGGNGDDQLVGRGGDDVLVGGAGNDWLGGDAGNDLLIGGSTTLTASDLDSAGFFWAFFGFASPSVTAPGAVTDTQSDTMRGGTGADWFVANPFDSILDNKPGQGDLVTTV